MKVRWIVILLAVGVGLDLLISLALGFVAVQAKHAASSAHITRVAAYESCLANNEAKKADLDRWNAIVKLLETGKLTPQLGAFIAGVEKANGAADAPRSCGALVP